jgi:DNA-binding response OmpR family regulator
MASNMIHKVLIADDEPHIVMAIEFLLETAGYEVFKAFNGIDAINLALSIRPDIIVLDVMMPGADGFSVAQTIRRQPDLEHTRILFLSARGTPKDKSTGYKSGGEYYLVKPFDNEKLVNTVREIIEFG